MDIFRQPTIEKWRLCQVLYDGLEYQTKTLLESMCQGGFLKKDETDGWLLYEQLAENTIQWEPTPEKFRTNDPTSSKGGIHSIEANIATDAKLAAVMRRLEALETKEPVSVNQVSPTSSAGCTYCQDRNHVFEECPVFIAHQCLPEHTSAAFTRPANNPPANNPYSPTYNPGWRNHPNLSWGQSNNDQTRPKFSNNFQNPPYQNPPPSFQYSQMETRLSNLERKVDTIVKSNDTLAQVLTRIEMQMNQQERQKGTLPSQPFPNPRNSSQAHLAEENHMSQCNAIHTLRSGKQVDNQVSTPSSSKQAFSLPDPTPSQLDANNTKKDKSAKNMHKPIAPYPNRLKDKQCAQMDKVREIFNQVKINIPLLDAIQQVPKYAKFIKDMCTKKRKTNVPKKVFLATNISELLSNQIPVKYKDPGCPTISCTIGQTAIKHALLDLGASINLLPFSVYQQLGLGELSPTKVTIQLADRSIKIPKGEITDVLVQVGEFIYPVDFVVLETEPVSTLRSQTPVILGRPFLATANAIINCRNGSMRLTFGNMTKEVNVFNLENQSRKIKDQTFEVNFIENICEKESENESLFLDKLFEDKCDFSDKMTHVEDYNFKVPFKKRRFDLSIFKEPSTEISHENIVQETPIDLTFESLFEEELLCLDTPIKEMLVNYSLPGKSVDLSFEEMYGTELEFLGKEVPTERCDEFLNNGGGHMMRKNLKKMKLGGEKVKTKMLVSPLCLIKRTHWNDGKRARGMNPKQL